MYYPSLFDSFFSPTKVIVVSEERLQAAEKKAKQEQIEAVDARINDLTAYKADLHKELNALDVRHGKDLDALDRQALTGECDV